MKPSFFTRAPQKPFPFLLVSLFCLTFLLAGCGPTAQQKLDYQTVGESGVSPAIYDKMMHGDPLGVNDIIALARARVNDGIVIRYIRDHETVYFLSGQEIQVMQSNGVSPSVIDYMVRTGYGQAAPAGYVYPPIAIGLGFGFHFH